MTDDTDTLEAAETAETAAGEMWERINQAALDGLYEEEVDCE
jgi:hypothetical protein